MRKVLVILWFMSLVLLTACCNEKKSNQSNTLDLTNCISYFDWCNICSVQSWQITSCTTNICDDAEMITETKCLKTIEEYEAENTTGK